MSKRVIPKNDWPRIWKRYKSGENSTDIAKDYGCNPTTICAGLRRSGYKLRPQRVSILRGRKALSKAEQDARHYAKHGEKIKERMRKQYKANPEFYRLKTKRAIGQPPPAGITEKRCNRCRTLKAFREFGKRRSGKFGLRPRCKQCEAEEAREYRERNPEKVRQGLRRYRETTPIEKLRSIRNRSNAKRMKNPAVKLESLLRKQLLGILKSRGIRKSPKESALELVGCTVEELKLHLEKRFLKGMNWGNHGIQRSGGPPKWHVDHIKDVRLFDLSIEAQRRECFHYTNLQPLWAVDNIRKSNKGRRRVQRGRQLEGL